MFSNNSSSQTPLPKLQLAIVFLIQLTEPIAATVIYPFINQFVNNTGITGGNEKKTGYYAGIIESAFFLAECFTVMLWGMASDRFGRRPILLLGPLGLCLATLCFGLSTQYRDLMIFRSIQGAFNGNIGVSKTILAELSDSTNIAQIFSLAPMIWCIGVIMGPSIGGVLANPEQQFPSTLGKIALLREHPFFLPCAVVAFLALSFFLVALIGLKETHHVKKHIETTKSKRVFHFEVSKKKLKKDFDAHSQGTDATTRLNSDSSVTNYGAIQKKPSTSTLCSIVSTTSTLDADLESDQETVLASDSEDEEDSKTDIEPPATLKSILIPDVLLPIANYSLIALLDSSYTVLIPLTYTTSVPAGGLGLTPFHVGLILSVWGAANIPFPIFCIPRLIKRFGARTVNFVGVCSFLVGFGSLSGLSMLAGAIGYANWLVWALIPLQFLLSNTVGSMAYATAQIFVVNGAPSKSALGATNGLCQASKTMARTFGPVLATSLFSLSKEHDLFGGYLVYVVFMLITFVCMRTTMSLPREMKNLG
ncbi:major facilitator superfamily domain-containing protein [Lentinula detonsa]|uniref:Major facilitator superfamily domain-containing protein n=1 Tax=Lentinula detonsa TaxID=2804962 RepID=A0A9W8NVS7_9AGAR|nr:major facilitator superfamily domain-containing protein [Lentinula detonsa]KAJ3984197.1 major facilitator superfamily domain-containing protein [Lentinula detonsa]